VIGDDFPSPIFDTDSAPAPGPSSRPAPRDRGQPRRDNPPPSNGKAPEAASDAHESKASEHFLPRNTTAEEALLGGCLLHPDAIDDAATMIRAEHFYSGRNAAIWSAMLALRNDSKAVDAVTLADYLDGNQALQSVGGVQYLMELLETVPHAAHSRHYASIVVDCWQRRQLIEVAESIGRDSRDFNQTSAEVIARADTTLVNLLDHPGEHQGADIGTILVDALFKMNDRWSKPGTLDGLTIGYDDVDKILQGIPYESLAILAARPSMGKTAFVLQLAANIAKRGEGVLMFSLEMPRMQLVERLLVSESRVNMEDVKIGRINEVDRHAILEAAAVLDKLPIWISDRAQQSISSITADSRVRAKKQKLGMIIIDYLQLMEAEDRKIPREQQIASISRRLKGLAKDLGVPVMALSQMNRAVETRIDKRPRLSDLRESGAIEQDADQVMFLHRPEYYEEPLAEQADYAAQDAHARKARPGEAEIIIAKNRHGPTGSAWLWFRGWNGRFESKAADHYGD
jgi:replicative DNA helicase